MSKIKKLVLNGTTYTISDENAVAFDAAQELTAQQQTQARANIGAAAVGEGGAGGASALIVTVTDEVAADHTPAEIYAHVQAGGTAVLLLDGIYFGMTRVTTRHAEFSSATDENLIDYIKVNEDGSVERMEHLFASQEMLDGTSVPVFDLAAMGMSAIPFTGGEAVVATDTTEIMSALGNGPVTFAIPISDGVETTLASVTMCGFGVDGSYICTSVLRLDAYFCLAVQVIEGYLVAVFAPMETGGSIAVDSELSETSENPVQNKVVTAALIQMAEGMEQLAANTLPTVTADDNGKVLAVVDGTWQAVAVAIPDDYHINSLIDAKLGVIENGTY